MFVGHYGVAFATKTERNKIPLWVLFVAVQLLDFLWAPFVLLGIEKVRFAFRPDFRTSAAVGLGGDRETDQKQIRSSTPGQTKRMTNVIRNVIAIAILAIIGKGSVVDSVPSRRRNGRRLTRRSRRVT